MKCALIPIVVLVPKTSPRPRISRALLRHTLREQIRCVSDGLNPMNVIRDERLNRTIPTNGGTPSCCRPRHPHFRARRLEGCSLLVFWTAISDRAIVDQNERRTRHAKQPARHDHLSRRCFPVSIRIWCSGRRVRSHRHTEMSAWLYQNCGSNGWAMIPSRMRGVINNAVSI
jgi:hypothetical protein